MPSENPSFLKEKYADLASSEPVERATLQARREAKREGAKSPHTKEERIQVYLDRLERLALDPEKEQQRTSERKNPPPWLQGESRPRALSLLREMLMNEYVRPNKMKMAEGAARVEERAARQMGIAAQYGEQELAQRGDIAVQDLEKSLDNWILYLSDANEPYPTWFRYYVFRNVLDLGDYDKDKEEFTKRSRGSARLFPDIDRGALAWVEDQIEAAKDPEKLERLQKAQQEAGTPKDQFLTPEKAQRFAKLPFAKQYVEGIKQAGEITPEMREETKGKWIKYGQGTEPTALWASLQNKGTAWCTKGFATAEKQLKGGDFYVYYTHDRQAKPTIPRIAIRLQDNMVFEVRGVADTDQNLEGNMVNIAQEKLNELPGADQFKKKSADMKRLTAVEKKMKVGENLTKDDLVFLYELYAPIEGFGYQKDLRIKELRSQRNPEEDMRIVFECTKEQIASNVSAIHPDTKAYVGQLEPGIFDKIQEYNIGHIYTSFPEGRIRKETIQIGGKDAETLIQEMRAKNINISLDAEYILRSKNFTVLEEPEDAILIRLKVRDLGINKAYTTTEDIFGDPEKGTMGRIQVLGLELCPAEVASHYRLKYTSQPLDERLSMGMEPITVRGARPRVFRLVRRDDGLWLDLSWAKPANEWDPGSELVFRLRKLKNLKT